MEFEDHLIIIIEIAFIDRHAIINKILIFMKLKENKNGKVDHITRDIKIFIIGDSRYNIKLDFRFRLSSFLISLIASAIGCKIPIMNTLLGPFRFWIYLIIFRSIRVKNAILTIIEIIKTRIFKYLIIIKCKFFTLLVSKTNSLYMII